MKTFRDLAEFSSTKFSPILPDQSQVNPGIYGAELAFWLCVELAHRGVVTSYPEFEDWGWYLSYSPSGEDAEFSILCSNMEGFSDRWLITLESHSRKLFGRDKPPFSMAGGLVDALHRLLESEPSITNLDWRGLDA